MGNVDNLDIKLAVATIFVEMIYRDDDESEVEETALIDGLISVLQIEKKEADDLFAEAQRKKVNLSNCEAQTKILNARFSYQQKCELITQLWRTAYADKQLHRDEAYFVQSISNQLEVSQEDFDACRAIVRKEVL